MGVVRKVDEPLDLDDIDTLSEYEAQAIANVSAELAARLRSVRASAKSKAFIAAILNRNIAGADISLSWSEFADVADFLSGYVAEQIAAGALEGLYLPDSTPAVRYVFDRVDPRVLEVARRRAANLIVEITTEQRELVRGLVVEALTGRFTVDQLAELVSNSIGLHSRWQRAVRNQYERTVHNLIMNGMDPIAAERRAWVLNGEYADRLLDARAQAIARTEILSAHNEGRWLGWEQAVADGLAPTNAMKRWLVRVPSRADSPCVYCEPIADNVIPWNDMFVGPRGEEVMMPPLHPNCVCTAVLVFPDDAEYLPV